MARPNPGETWRDPIYGKYPGTARLHMDAVPLDFSRLFTRTIWKKGAKVVQLRRASKELEKRFATIVYVARCAGEQPPPILIFKGKPSTDKKRDLIDTHKPASRRLRKELPNYDERVWVYWDPKFRTSTAT